MAGGKKQPLQPSNSANIQQTSSNGVKGKTIEETYQKKTQLEHILLRPDTYVGSIEKHTQSLWVYEGNQMVHRSISYVPGLYKIFDEILVNAADNKQRDPSMDSVKVEISVEDNCISVYNNGDGVPVEIHQEEGVYVPEMIFGHLLTSSNYDDSEKKTTGGRNGYGAKLANIFSTEFIIETADGKRQKKYKQVFRSNMGIKSDPVITKCKPGENWTKITFKPDLIKFNMTHLEDDVVSLMRKRVVDIAGCLGKTVKVELNGQRLPVKTFQDYIGLYLQAASKSKPEPLPRIYEKVSDRWEICVSLSDGQFQQVSFVNGIATIKGGSHVDLVSNQITTHVMNIVNKKNKNAAVKAHTIKNHLWIFVNSLIDNPAFDSQTKETLTTRQNSFGSKCELSQELLKKVAKCGVVENILSWADFKQSKDLKKTDGTKRQRLTGITKLDDANDAGGRNSEKCTLILTEGDSAKALAMAGLAVVGRNHYGVFPLRGKLLNVREASHKQIMENAEIQSIKQILGLQHGKEYNSVKSLRYGHLMIMTDQDHDGSHIKGLLINFIHSFWPSLLKIPSFLVEFITPIVKATHKNGRVLSFYTMPEYESWRESLGGSASGWTIKYYKGLGTSTSKEGKEYFKNLAKHKKDFMWINEEDGDAIELAFSKKKIEARKNWLRQFEPGTYLDQTETLIKYSDFVNKELILFSMADLQRSIPSMVDGLKPGQRKILFCSFKRNFVTQAKVAQFSGYVSEHSAYHHGEQSLASTIIGMAQDFVGSNNINLLAPLGQFGTRAQGGKDHASTRYVFTCLSPITRFLFPKEDDVLLDYLNEDGQKIEPTWYAPIIPMVLVNGSEGIGTGWSSFVPNYNPRDIIANIKHMLNDEPLQPMVPWYKGFKGTIEQTSTKDNGVSYTVSGIIEEINETTLRITELPIRKWTQDYKEFLEALMTGNDKIKEPFIRDYKEYNTDTRVHFEVSLSEENMKVALQEGLLKKFRLTTTISTTNMHLFDSKGIIHKYETPEQVLVPFYHLRLELYEKRKKVQLENLQLELLKLDNKVRFILGVVNGEIIVNNRKRADLLLELKNKGFTPFPKKGKPVEAAIAGAIPEVEESPEDNIETAKGVRAGDYEYLLSMAIGTLTLEKVQQLCAERDKVEDDVEELKKATPKSLWCKDLDAFIRELEGQELQEAKDDEYELSNMGSDAARIFRQVGKNQKKTTKKTVTAEKADSQSTTNNQASTVSVSTSNAQKETAKPKEGGGGKKGAAKKQMEVENDGDDELDTTLQDRLAAYNNGLSADQSAIEDQGSMHSSQNENLKPKQKEPTRREKKAAPIYVDMSDEEEDKIGTVPEEEYEEEGEKQLRQVGTKGKKAANGRRKAMVVSDSDSDFGIEDAESDYEEALPKESKKLAADKVTKPSKINPTKSSNGRIRKAMVVSDSDSDYGIEDAESDYEEALPKESKKLAADKTTKPSKINPTQSSNGRRRKAMVVSDSDSDFGIEDAESDYEETLPKESKELAESDYEETLPKESKELAADKATKPSKINPTKSTSTTTAPVPTKRGPKRASQGQKLIDEMLKPSTSDDDAVHIVQPSPYRKSPENEIRKKKPSPFNNKSGSIMSNLRQGSQISPPSANGSVGSSSNSPEEVNEVPKPAGGRRPQRANQAPVQYVLSESSDEDYENEVEINDSDFAEDDD